MNRRSQTSRRTAASEPTKTILEVRNGGGHRGARAMLPTIQEFNRRSVATAIRPVYADPFPGRGTEIVAEAKALAIPARAEETKIERLVETEGTETRAPVVLNVDDLGGVAQTSRILADAPRSLLAYYLMRVPLTENFYGFRWMLAPDDAEGKHLGALLAGRMSEVAAKGGSRHVLGDRGRPEHRSAELLYRKWFADHFEQNLARAAVDLPSESSPFEVTRDGVTTEPLFVRDVTDLDPVRLARDLVANPPAPLVRGENFAIAAVLPKGVSILHVRLRRDGQLSFQGGATIDFEAIQREEAIAREEARREAEAREAAAREAERRAAQAREIAERAAAARETLGRVLSGLIERAERATATPTNPVYVTD